MPFTPPPRPPSSVQVENDLTEALERVREKINCVTGDSGKIKLSPTQTKMAQQTYKEHCDSLGTETSQEMQAKRTVREMEDAEKAEDVVVEDVEA